MKKYTPLFKRIHEDLIMNIMSAISIVEYNSIGLLEEINFDDFIKLNIVLNIKKGNTSFFSQFWARVNSPYCRFSII